MWKSSVCGVILNQIQFSFSGATDDDAERIYSEVFAALEELAWFHRVPVLMLATMTTIVCVIRYWKKLDELEPEKRQRFIDQASKVTTAPALVAPDTHGTKQYLRNSRVVNCFVSIHIQFDFGWSNDHCYM